MNEKATIRKQMLQLRKLAEHENIQTEETQIVNRLLQKLATDQNASTIHCFLPIHGELDIWPTIKNWLSAGIKVVCPKVIAHGQLEHLVLHAPDALASGPLGTLYPASNEIYRGTYDLIIVPGLAFDKQNHRLGYGKGYYDRFLMDQPNVIKAGIAFSFQIIDKLPVEPHDIALNLVITA